jgi:hypothetical protein
MGCASYKVIFLGAIFAGLSRQLKMLGMYRIIVISMAAPTRVSIYQIAYLILVKATASARLETFTNHSFCCISRKGVKHALFLTVSMVTHVHGWQFRRRMTDLVTAIGRARFGYRGKPNRLVISVLHRAAPSTRQCARYSHVTKLLAAAIVP